MKRILQRKTMLICLGALLAAIIVIGIIALCTTDRSAVVGVEGVKWQGRLYSYTGGKYTEGKTIARGQGSWEINEVEQDPSHTFIVVRSFLDQHLCVADDYTIPTSGKVTMAKWNNWDFIYDEEFLSAVTEIVESRETSFIHETDAIFALSDNQRMKSLYFAYEGCPVATEYQGYMGKINGEWVLAIEMVKLDDSMALYEVRPYSCYTIPDKYISVLEKYFFE